MADLDNNYVLTEDEMEIASAIEIDPVVIQHSLEHFNEFGEVLVAHSEFEGSRKYRYTKNSRHNKNGVQNHFQGIQRLDTPGYVAMAGSNIQDQRSEIMFYEMESRSDNSPWLSNVARDKDGDPNDRYHYTIQLWKAPLRNDGIPRMDRILWHGGGMDALGPILAIPLEHNHKPPFAKQAGIPIPDDNDNSAVRFLDLSDIMTPKIFEHGITRDAVKAGAVALTRLACRHYMCGVWRDEQDGTAFLDLYLSENDVFDGRFRQSIDDVQTITTYVDNNFDVFPLTNKFQTINFVHTLEGIHMLGFHLSDGHHMIDIFKLIIDHEELAPDDHDHGMHGCQLQIVKSINFSCTKKFCNFKAASGSYILPHGELALYSSAEFLSSKKLYFSEFRRPLPKPPTVTLNTSFIEFYNSATTEGLSFTIRDLTDNRADIDDFKKVYAREKHYNDKTWSIRLCLPTGRQYRLYNNKKHKKPILTLTGTGKVETVSLMALGIAKKLSSAKLL